MLSSHLIHSYDSNTVSVDRRLAMCLHLAPTQYPLYDTIEVKCNHIVCDRPINNCWYRLQVQVQVLSLYLGHAQSHYLHNC